MTMRKQLFLGALFGLAYITPASADETLCKNFATAMISHVVNIFHDKAQSEAAKRQSLSVVFQQAVDTDWIGKFVLGRFWKEASSEQQARYLKDYRTYITQNYVSKFNDEDGMSVDNIVIASLSPQAAGQFEAKTLIQRKGEEDVKVDYLLDDSSGKCQVHDIKVEGVSLLTTQRSEFTTLASSSGVQGVVDAMEKKIAH